MSDPEELHFDLEPLGEDRCPLTVINVLSDRSAAARNGAGWNVCLAELDKWIGGRAVGPHSETAEPCQPYYDAYIAAGTPSGAEIPSAVAQP